MMVRDVADRIEARLPCDWSEEWDNVGLIIGDPEAEVKGIAVSLDATEESVAGAVEKGCDMLVVHHPAIFRPLKRVLPEAPAAATIIAAVRSGVAVYSSHTNWDSSPEGVNVILSDLLGLRGAVPIMPPHNGAWGMGAIGDLPAPLTLNQLALAAKEAWGLSSLLAYGGGSDQLSRVALCGGAGGDFLQPVVDMGADVFITADVSYHYLLHAQLSGIHLIVVNHGEMERASLPGLCVLLREVSSLDVVLLENSNWIPEII